MPPKSKRAQTEEEASLNREAKRLRQRAESYLISGEAPQVEGSSIPHALRKCDGADIVKRNTTRKKKYLFVFPGGARFPPGAKLGELTGLDTKTPVMYLDFDQGRIKLRGSLVFPKNGLVCVKGGKKVQVVDCFDCVVCFAEWAWIGKGNPGEVSEVLPEGVRGDGEGGELWKQGNLKGVVRKVGKEKEKEVVEVESSEEDGLDVSGLDEDSAEGGDGMQDEWAADVKVTPREGSRRKRARVNYADVENLDEEEEEDGDEEGVEEVRGGKRRRISFSQLSNDNSDGDGDG